MWGRSVAGISDTAHLLRVPPKHGLKIIVDEKEGAPMWITAISPCYFMCMSAYACYVYHANVKCRVTVWPNWRCICISKGCVCVCLCLCLSTCLTTLYMYIVLILYTRRWTRARHWQNTSWVPGGKLHRCSAKELNSVSVVVVFSKRFQKFSGRGAPREWFL